jgi:hypothetical protein
MRPLSFAVFAPLVLLSATASAQSLAVRGGTTGFGLDFGVPIHDKFGLRAAYHGGSVSRSLTESGVRYESELKFGTGLFLADFFPAASNFRISAGLGYNNNRWDLTAGGGSGTIELNGTDYPASDVRITGKLRFNKANPYIGVGWGTAAKSAGTGWFFSADLGALFVNPSAQLNAACPSGFSSTQCAQFQADLQAEQQDLTDSLSFRTIYPVLSFGIGYRF